MLNADDLIWNTHLKRAFFSPLMGGCRVELAVDSFIQMLSQGEVLCKWVNDAGDKVESYATCSWTEGSSLVYEGI